MRKYIITIAFLLIFTAGMIGWPLMAIAAADTVTFDADTTLDLWGIGQTLTVSSGSEVAGLTVYANYITIALDNGSSITLTSPAKKVMQASPSIAETTCTAAGSTSTIILSGTTDGQTVIITPSTDVCHPASETGSSGGGGGGGGGARKAL